MFTWWCESRSYVSAVGSSPARHNTMAAFTWKYYRTYYIHRPIWCLPSHKGIDILSSCQWCRNALYLAHALLLCWTIPYHSVCSRCKSQWCKWDDSGSLLASSRGWQEWQKVYVNLQILLWWSCHVVPNMHVQDNSGCIVDACWDFSGGSSMILLCQTIHCIFGRYEDMSV